MFDRHILIVTGTDGGEAFALEHELELYVQAGIPALNALQAATYNPAKDCNLLQQYGMIKKGYAADMILIDGNPETNISDIRRVEWVIKTTACTIPNNSLPIAAGVIIIDLFFCFRLWHLWHRLLRRTLVRQCSRHQNEIETPRWCSSGMSYTACVLITTSTFQ